MSNTERTDFGTNPHYLDATDLDPTEVIECDNCGETGDVQVVTSNRMERETGYREDDALLCAACRQKKGMGGGRK